MSNGRHVSCQVVKMVKYGVAGDPRCQDEMLKQLPPVAEQTEYTTLKSELLPRMHTLCLKTTSASVRVNSLTCMGRIVARLDEDEAGKMLQTAGKVCLLVCLQLPVSKHTVCACFVCYLAAVSVQSNSAGAAGSALLSSALFIFQWPRATVHKEQAVLDRADHID